MVIGEGEYVETHPEELIENIGRASHPSGRVPFISRISSARGDDGLKVVKSGVCSSYELPNFKEIGFFEYRYLLEYERVPCGHE
jgi:hypothetical protein